MGAWAEDSFGNDSACDWIYEFLKNPSFEKIEQELNFVLEEKDFIDSDVGCRAIAACEVIARLKGNWGVRNSYSEALDNWIEANPSTISDTLIKKALKTIEKLLGKDSELLELWDEGGVNQTWHNCMDDLKHRLKSI